jgi:signal transduction histidine kinase/CheY-like chemotaxis protein
MTAGTHGTLWRLLVRPLHRARDLPLPWKVAIPPLMMVLIFAPPAFVIVRDLSSRAEGELHETMTRRAEQATADLREKEFYLLESVRLGANVEGVADAIQRRDARNVQGIFGSVIALKDGLDVLVTTDGRGVGLAEFSGPGGQRVVSQGTDWSQQGPVRDVLFDPGAANRAGFITQGGHTLLVSAGPVRRGDQNVGVVVAGLRLSAVASEASARAGASLALYDVNGNVLSAHGGLARRPPDRRPSATATERRATVGGTEVEVLYVPFTAGGSRIGTLAIALPRQPAFALAHRVTRNLELLLALAIGIGVLLLIPLTRYLLAQLADLTRTNTALGTGDLKARASVISRDEFGQVAEGLNAMAQELQASYEKLEQRVEERTSELRQARDAAEEATRMKAQFLANMSHEIRTPMNAVIGMTSLLGESTLDERDREYVDTIRASGDHLLTIINDILDFSKMEAGRLELETQPFSVRACVEEALDLVALKASNCGTELTYEIEEGAQEAIIGDLGRLRQVLLNLLSNAVKFTQGGEVCVTVGSRPLRRGRHEMQFTVRDTGIGMAANRMHRLFGAFSQLDPSTTRTHGGTGLGLAISKLLVELMGGRISVASKPGKGSTFTFTIEAEATDQPQTPITADIAVLEGKRVLIVDDIATNRRVASGYVRRWGMVPTDVATPADALQVLAGAEEFDLILLDHDMPGMSGVDLAKRIRRAHSRTPILMLTSIGEVPSKDKSDLAAVLTKPIKPSTLLDAVMVALLGPQTRPRTDAPAQTLDPTTAARLPLRILVAEDNPVNQKVLEATLGKLGYTADFVANGAEAVAAAERQPYDVLFMDVQMPIMDGLRATRTIVRRLGDARPRIVALTANATVEDRRRCMSAGMDDYLAKPVTPPKLVEALVRCSRSQPGVRGASRRKRSSVQTAMARRRSKVR